LEICRKAGMPTDKRRSTRLMNVRPHEAMTADTALVDRATHGDVTAFEALYRANNERIYNFARQIVLSDSDAADVVQESFVRAWRSLGKLRDGSAFTPWLYRIALTRCRELLSSRSRRAEVSIHAEAGEAAERQELAGDGPDPEACLLDGEVSEALRKALSTLSADHRAVIALHHLEEMEVADVADTLGIARGTVMSRLARARAALRRKLAPYVEDQQ
jgi:RNA polymerase sigma-70 factor, ECF subfamily